MYVLAALLLLAPPGGTVEIDGPRWQALEASRAKDERPPAPFAERRELVFTAVPGGHEVRARWTLRALAPGWFMGDVLGPGFELRDALWNGQPAGIATSDAGTTVAGYVRGPVDLQVVAFLPEEAAKGELRVMPAVRGRTTLIPLAAPTPAAAPEGADADDAEAADASPPERLHVHAVGGGALPRDGAAFLGGHDRIELLPAPAPRDEGGEALVLAHAGVGLTVGDAEVRGRARVSWQVRRGQLERASLRVDGLGADLELLGDGVRTWSRSGDRIDVELQAPVRDRLDLELRWTTAVARATESSQPLPRIEPEGVWRTEAAVQIAKDGEVEILPELAGWAAIPAAALPPWARDLVEGTPTAAYQSGEPRPGRLDLLRFVPEPGPAVVVDVADYTIASSHEGRLLVRALFEVRNERASHLRITPPAGMRILGARVGLDTALPARDRNAPGAWLIPLRRSVETVKGALSFPVEVILVGESEAWRRREKRDLALPAVNAPVAVTRLTLHLPPGYTSRLDPGDGDVVRDFDRGEGIAYGFGTGEVGAAEADARFQQAVDAWLKNDFTSAQRELDALRQSGARSENIDRLQANLDVVGGQSGGDATVERRIKEQAKARAVADLQEQAAVEKKAEAYRQSGDYERAEEEYTRALEIGEKLAKLEQKESVEQSSRNVAIAEDLKAVKKKAKDRGPRRKGKLGGASSSVVYEFDDDSLSGDLDKNMPQKPAEADSGVVFGIGSGTGTGVAQTGGGGGELGGEVIEGERVRPDSATTTTITTDEARAIPVGGTPRDFTAVVDMAPAASEDSAGIRLAGTTGPESHYVVDGANVTSVTQDARRSPDRSLFDEPLPPPPAPAPPEPEPVVATTVAHESISIAPGRARRSRGLRRIFRRSDTGGAPSPKSAPPPDTDADGLVDEVDDGEGLPAGAKGQPLDLLPPPQVTASSLSVVIPAAGEAVRYQHLLLAADVPYTVEIKAREPLRQKRKRR